MGLGGRENVNDFAVGSVPTVFYVPDFITDAEEQLLLNNIYQAPTSKWKSLKNRRLQNWGGVVHEKGLLAQDLPAWLTGITGKICEASDLFPSAINHVLINEYLPHQGIMPHQDGPAYHPVVAILSLGSPAVMDFTPHSSFRLCTNTLGNGVEDKGCEGNDLGIKYDNWVDDYHPFSVLLMPRSLLIFKDKAYSDYLHGIKDSVVQQCSEVANISEPAKSSLDRAVEANGSGFANSIHRTTARISLTCRVVSKVHKKIIQVLGPSEVYISSSACHFVCLFSIAISVSDGDASFALHQ